MGNVFDIPDEEECLEACSETTGCVWATYFEKDDFCALTANCHDTETCDDCSIASINNANCDIDDGDASDAGDAAE